MTAAYKGKFNESDKAQEIRTYLLQSKCIPLNNETILNKEDDSLINCILGFYKDNEVCSTEFGDIIINSNSIQNCISHNKRWNAFRWYLILKQVLENGEVILPMKAHGYHNKKLKTGIIAAPVNCDGIRYFFCIVISCNLNKKLEIYDFNYFTKEKLSEIAANNKRSVHDSNSATLPQVSKSPANILINLLISKEEDLNKPNNQNKCENNQENSNYNYINTMANKTKKALYESIMKDVAKTVKRHLNEAHSTWLDVDIDDDIKDRSFYSTNPTEREESEIKNRLQQLKNNQQKITTEDVLNIYRDVIAKHRSWSNKQYDDARFRDVKLNEIYKALCQLRRIISDNKKGCEYLDKIIELINKLS